MRRDISYYDALRDHPEQLNQVIEEIQKSKSKFSKTDPKTWTWYYWWACHGISVKGATHDECIDYMMSDIVTNVSLCAQPSLRGVVRYADVSKNVIRDWVEDYIHENFQQIIRWQSHPHSKIW